MESMTAQPWLEQIVALPSEQELRLQPKLQALYLCVHKCRCVVYATCKQIIVATQDVVHAIQLSEATFQKIKWNFFWACGFNFVGIPLAAGMLYPRFHVSLPPMFAGLAMACSSVTVVTTKHCTSLVRETSELLSSKLIRDCI